MRKIENLAKEICQIHSLLLNKSKESSVAIAKIHPTKQALDLAKDYITKSGKLMKLFLYFLKILDTTHIKFLNKEKKNTLM